MKKKKRAKQFIAKKWGEDTVKKNRSGTENSMSENTAINPLAEFGNVRSIQNSPADQMRLYQCGDLDKMEYFFIHGGCFERQVQRQMIKDDNLAVLNVFLKYWEFTPDERVFMIKQASLEFFKTYLKKKSLGKQLKDFIGCGRFSRTFWAEIYEFLTPDGQKMCREAGKLPR
mgnify:CR=1 FL=1